MEVKKNGKFSQLILSRWLAKCDRMVKIVNLLIDLLGPNGIYPKEF